MTNEYIALPVDLTVDQAIQSLRDMASEAKTTHYLYLTDGEEHLLGVISLWDLIISPPVRHIREFMVSPVIEVQATDSQEEVAAVLAKYNLLAVPVIDINEHMLGIVTVDDAIESVIPGAWKRRLPRVFS